MNNHILNPPAIVEADQRRATQVRQQISKLSRSLTDSSFDQAELLAEVIDNNYHIAWGYPSFADFLNDNQIDISEREVRYRRRILQGAKKLEISRQTLQTSTISKLKEIFTLNVDEFGTDIKRLIELSKTATLEEVKAEVKRLKGEAGEEEFTFRNFYLLRSAAEETVDTALENARIASGDSIDEKGEPKRPSDGQCLERICADFNSGFSQQKEHYHDIEDESGVDVEETE